MHEIAVQQFVDFLVVTMDHVEVLIIRTGLH